MKRNSEHKVGARSGNELTEWELNVKEYIMRRLYEISSVMLMAIFLLSSSLTAKDKSKEKTPPKQIADFTMVDNIITKLTDKMKKEVKKKYKFSSLELMSFGGRITRYAKWKDIEKETEIARSWYVKIGKIVSAMGDVKDNFYMAKANQEFELLPKYAEQYKKLQAQCLKLLDNPVKIKTKKRKPSARRR